MRLAMFNISLKNIINDQIWLTETVPYGTVIHCSALNPPVVSSVSLSEIEHMFDLVEFSIADSSELAVNVGVTSEESAKLDFSVGNLHVRSFSRFFVSYAPTARARCYIADELIPEGALRVSFGILSDYSNDAIAKHGLAEAILGALNGA
jgi:hypothetical protein